jgi:hypothetical protein
MTNVNDAEKKVEEVTEKILTKRKKRRVSKEILRNALNKDTTDWNNISDQVYEVEYDEKR